jgi:hypothetical protein
LIGLNVDKSGCEASNFTDRVEETIRRVDEGLGAMECFKHVGCSGSHRSRIAEKRGGIDEAEVTADDMVTGAARKIAMTDDGRPGWWKVEIDGSEEFRKEMEKAKVLEMMKAERAERTEQALVEATAQVVQASEKAEVLQMNREEAKEREEKRARDTRVKKGREQKS